MPAILSDSDDYLIEFTRQGNRNPLMAARSEIVRVAYSLDDEVPDPDSERDFSFSDDQEGRYLVRHSWIAVDRSFRSEPVSQVVLEKVEEVSFRYMNHEETWVDEWPEQYEEIKAVNTFKPVAIEMKILSLEYGDMTRTYFLTNRAEKGAAE
jgi:general secretion pathway protein J